MAAVTAGVFPTIVQGMMGIANNFTATTGDQLNAALIGAGTYYLPVVPSSGAAKTAICADTTWTTIKANSGVGALTEVANGSGYTTAGLLLTKASQAISQSTIWTTLTYSGTIQWTAATFTAYQVVFYDSTATTYQGICWWDFGGAQSCSSGTFTLTLGTANSIANALIQFSSTV